MRSEPMEECKLGTSKAQRPLGSLAEALPYVFLGGFAAGAVVGGVAPVSLTVAL